MYVVYLVIIAHSYASEPMKTCKKSQENKLNAINSWEKELIACRKRQNNNNAYRIPAAAGATALNIDIRVTEMPLATPLCSCVCTCFMREVKSLAK